MLHRALTWLLLALLVAALVIEIGILTDAEPAGKASAVPSVSNARLLAELEPYHLRGRDFSASRLGLVDGDRGWCRQYLQRGVRLIIVCTSLREETRA